MKKLLGIVVLGLLFSVNAYADDDIKIGMNFYEVNKILTAKGPKMFLNFPLKRTTKNKKYGHARWVSVTNQKITYAFENDSAGKMYIYQRDRKKYKLVKIFKSALEPYDYYLNFP